jgi:REP element-mobilizing transposase RayT
MSKKYHKGSSSKYLCKIHLIFATKYRKLLLKGAIEDDMKQILFEISNQSDFTIDVMESDIDHIHILIDYPPKLSISSIVKSPSTFFKSSWKPDQAPKGGINQQNLQETQRVSKTAILERKYFLVRWLFCLHNWRCLY